MRILTRRRRSQVPSKWTPLMHLVVLLAKKSRTPAATAVVRCYAMTMTNERCSNTMSATAKSCYCHFHVDFDPAKHAARLTHAEKPLPALSSALTPRRDVPAPRERDEASPAPEEASAGSRHRSCLRRHARRRCPRAAHRAQREPWKSCVLRVSRGRG